jgi:predicted nucleic acid-binding protein
MTIKRIYWDSCVFIDRISRKPEKLAILEELTDNAHDGKIVIVASTLCIAETYKIGESGDSWTVQQGLINAFFQNPWIELHQVDSFIAEDAQEIAYLHKLKPPDAIHIATALRARVDLFHTYDGSKSHSPLRYDRQIKGLPIIIPRPIDPQKPLAFGSTELEDGSKGEPLAVRADEKTYAKAAGGAKARGPEGKRPSEGKG